MSSRAATQPPVRAGAARLFVLAHAAAGLLGQVNVDFRVGELEVGEGRALLRLPRERSSAGLLMSQDEHVRRFMRMRGLLDCEDVHVYETILVPGDHCVAGRAAPAEPVEVFAEPS